MFLRTYNKATVNMTECIVELHKRRIFNFLKNTRKVLTGKHEPQASAFYTSEVLSQVKEN